MTEISTAALGDRIVLETVTCPLCLEIFEDPRTLECGHSLCAACLRSLIWDSTPNSLVGIDGRVEVAGRPMLCYGSCPLCRRQIRISDVPTNFALKGVVCHVLEQQKASAQCCQCGKQVSLDAQLVCRDCSDETDTMMILCFACAMSDHTSKDHLVSLRETARDEFLKTTVKKLRELFDKAQSVVDSNAKVAAKAFSVVSDFKPLANIMPQLSERIKNLESSQWCTKQRSADEIARAEKINKTIEEASVEYERILSATVAQIYDLQKQTEERLDKHRKEPKLPQALRTDASDISDYLDRLLDENPQMLQAINQKPVLKIPVHPSYSEVAQSSNSPDSPQNTAEQSTWRTQPSYQPTQTPDSASTSIPGPSTAAIPDQLNSHPLPTQWTAPTPLPFDDPGSSSFPSSYYAVATLSHPMSPQSIGTAIPASNLNQKRRGRKSRKCIEGDS